MSRPLRLEYEGAFYHIISRGNARENIFDEEDDFNSFLELLGKEIKQQNWQCYGYCLMNNHYHLLIETPESNLVRGMRRLNGTYSQYFNLINKKVGHVFQGRYKSIIVDKDSYLLELNRYIVLNPYRAGMEKSIGEWKWSSYRVTIGGESRPEWFNKDLIISHFSSKSREGIKNYKKFVEEGVGEENPSKNIIGQIWLGSKEFVKEVEGKVGIKESKEIPISQRRPIRPTANELIDVVKKEYMVDNKSIVERKNIEAYRAAVYLLRREGNLGVREVSEKFSISESMVSRIQREVEKNKNVKKNIERIIKKYRLQT